MSTALQVMSPEDRPATVALVRPAVTPAALVEVHKEITAIITQCLEKGRDYGVIPGTGKKNRDGEETGKPTLLKAGAERLAAAFGAFPRYELLESEIDHDREVRWSKRKKVWKNEYRGDKRFDWQEEAGASLGLYRYVVRCTLVRREDGAVIAEGIGSCSTLESKYVDRPRDSENTVLKMAEKRAMVAAALNGFGLSDRFTQDMEDLASEPESAAVDSQPVTAEQEPERRETKAARDKILPISSQKGKRLGDLSIEHIEGLMKWIRAKQEEKKDGSVFADLLDALGEVLAEKKEEVERDQVKLFEDDAQAAGPAPAGEELKGGRVEDALSTTEVEARRRIAEHLKNEGLPAETRQHWQRKLEDAETSPEELARGVAQLDAAFRELMARENAAAAKKGGKKSSEKGEHSFGNVPGL